MKSAELIGWALGGLEREITQTRDRLNALTTQAVQLRSRIAASAGGRPAGPGAGSPAAAGTRRRRKLTAEQRKAISDRMKKKWEERKSKSR